MLDEHVKYTLFAISEGISEDTLENWQKRAQYLASTNEEQLRYLVNDHLNVLEKDLEELKTRNYQFSEEQQNQIKEFEDIITEKKNIINETFDYKKKPPTINTAVYMSNIKKRCNTEYVANTIKRAVGAGLSEVEAKFYIIETFIPDILADICNILDKRESKGKKMKNKEIKAVSQLIRSLSNFAYLSFDPENYFIYAKQSKLLNQDVKALLEPYMHIYEGLYSFSDYFQINAKDIKKNRVDGLKIINDIKSKHDFLQNHALESKLNGHQQRLFDEVEEVFLFKQNELSNFIDQYMSKKQERSKNKTLSSTLDFYQPPFNPYLLGSTEDLAPASAPTEVPAPASASTEDLAPASASTEVPAPVSASTEVPAPASVPTEDLTPESVTTEVPAPESASTEVLTPESAPTEDLAPVSASTEGLTPAEASSSLTGVVTPTQGASATEEDIGSRLPTPPQGFPQQSCSSVKKKEARIAVGM